MTAYVADYELVDDLGHTNQGRLFKAKPPARLGLADEHVALKVLDQRATEEEFARLAAELRIVAGTDSPHVIRFYDAGNGAGILYLATRFHPGGTLESNGLPVDSARAARVVADAALGAHHLHEAAVVHRDIRPANILIDEHGRGVLTDLGLAQHLKPGSTTTGFGPIGTIGYMEPDVVWGEKASRQSDIWSLGVTLHAALSGVLVHSDIPSRSVVQAFSHVLHNEPTINARIPEPFQPILGRCLASARDDRYPTALELARDIERAGGLS